MSRIAEAYHAKHGRYPDAPGHKVDGPAKEAAESLRGKGRELHDKILRELARAPQTTDEVAETLKLSVLLVRPRFSELLAKKKIEDTGVRRRNKDSRKSATVWRPAP